MMKRQKQQEKQQGGGIAEVARQRISQLVAERAQFVAEANKQIAAYNGAIAELSALVNPPKQEKTLPEG